MKISRKALLISALTTILLVAIAKANGQAVTRKAYVENIAGDSTLPIETIQKLTELKPMFQNFKIVSFNFVMSNKKVKKELTIISNEGPKFNKEILDALKLVREGAFIIFDEIKASNNRGQIIKLDMLLLNAF